MIRMDYPTMLRLREKHPAAFEAGSQVIDQLSHQILLSTGYLMIHALNDGGYCCHWNAEDEQGGCQAATIGAVLNHVAQHLLKNQGEVCSPK